MKSNRSFAAPLATALLLGTSSAFAQPDVLTLPTVNKTELAPLDAANWRAIRVKNVRPSLVAWQLDPAHNKMPAYFNLPYTMPLKHAADTKTQKPDEKRVEDPFDVPDNVRLAAADDQNLLFVTGGNAQQLARLQELVSILDQPLRKVELEAQMVELPAAQIKQFGISTDAATPGAPDAKTPVKGAFQTGFVREDFQKRINELVAAGKAKVSSTKPQIITNNTGLAVSLRSGPIDNTGANQNKMPAAPTGGTDTIITLTPTINGDETITVLMHLAMLPTTPDKADLLTIANLHDGQTIALTDLKSSAFPRETTPQIPTLGDIPLMNSTTKPPVPLLSDIPIIGRLFRPIKPEDERAVLVFVTARLLH